MTKTNASPSAEKIDEALELLRQAASESKDELKHILTGKHSELEDLLKVVGAEVHGAMHHGRERLEDMRDAGENKLRDAADTMDRRLHEDPWRMLGWTTAAAFVLGFLAGNKD